MISDCSDSDYPDVGLLEGCDIFQESNSIKTHEKKSNLIKNEPSSKDIIYPHISVARVLYDNITSIKSGDENMCDFFEAISFCKSLKKEKIMKSAVYSMDILTLDELIFSGRIKRELTVIWPPCNDDFQKMEENEFLYIVIGENDLNDLDSFCNNFQFYLKVQQKQPYKLTRITVIQLIDIDHIIDAVEKGINDFPAL